MGHVHLAPLPRTRKWKQIVELIEGGAAAGQIATATVKATEGGFKSAPNDDGVLESYWLLIRLSLAARTGDFTSALRQCGLDVPDNPSLLDIAVAYSSAVDAKMPNYGKRTDLSEMAQSAGIETINSVIGTKSQSLFGSGPDEVRRAFSSLATAKQFGSFAWRFFSSFAYRFLSYFLGKALPSQIGDGKRFRTVADQVRFTDSLSVHCQEASKVLERFSGDWFSLHRFQAESDITREETQRFWATR